MIKDVLVVCKTHLDIGFTDLAAKVKERYFKDYLEQAVAVAEHYRQENQGRNYVWTVGSWLVYEYLRKFKGERRQLLENAIRRGDLVWHALPFTMHSELNSAFLFARALQISRTLDQQFHRHTIAAKMTDVPGHTRGIVAPLAEAGVKLLHIGINPASAQAEVPPIFRWQDSRGHSIMVIYQGQYGSPCVFPDKKTVLCMELTNDNHGPHTIEEMDALYDRLAQAYPHARIRCTTLNEAARILAKQAASLPVVTAGIGDTWIHGIGSDPLKVGQFKNLLRWREEQGQSTRLTAFDAELLQIAEHTWGMDEKTWIPHDHRFLGTELAALQYSPNGQRFASSWREQRTLITTALRQLPKAMQPEAKRVRRNSPRHPYLDPAELCRTRKFKTAFFTGKFGFDGALERLTDEIGNPIADADHPLFQLWGETFSKADYSRFYKEYNRGDYDWARQDFTKPGLPKSLKHQILQPKIKGIYHHSLRHGEKYLLVMTMPSNDATGMPDEIYLTYYFGHDAPRIAVTLDWFGKFPARIPHAIHFSCRPLEAETGHWNFSKLGEPIEPANVVVNGARNLHAMDEAITCRTADGALVFRSFHAPLVALGKPRMLHFDNQLPDLTQGIHYNLYNNLWGTNFPMWYGDNTRFRFELDFIL